MKPIVYLTLLFIMFGSLFIDAQAQVHVGVYHSGLINQVGVGTDNEKKFFGEMRVLATDLIDFPNGVEALGHINLKRGEWVNLHAGLMFGVFFEGGGSSRVGIPLGLTFKPIQAHRNFAILMEATPNTYIEGGFAIRSNIGIRYSFRRE